MSKPHVAFLILVGWTFAILAALAQQNLVENGAFEIVSDAGFTAWDISATNSDSPQVIEGYTGQELSLVSTDPEAPTVAVQTLNLTMNTKYELSFWAMYSPSLVSNVTDQSQRSLIAAFGTDGRWIVDAPVASWHNFTYDAHGNGTSDSVSFTGYDVSGGGFVVDNVTLVESPLSPSPSNSSTPSSTSDDPAALMNKVNLIWGVVGSIIAALGSLAGIYLCLDRCGHKFKRRYGRLPSHTA